MKKKKKEEEHKVRKILFEHFRVECQRYISEEWIMRVIDSSFSIPSVRPSERDKEEERPSQK